MPRDSAKAAGFACGSATQTFLHIIEATEVDQPAHPPIEHFAFEGIDLRGLMQRLDDHGIAYNLSHRPNEGLVTVNLRDPDDNRLHVDFAASEWKAGMVPLRVSAR